MVGAGGRPASLCLRPGPLVGRARRARRPRSGRVGRPGVRAWRPAWSRTACRTSPPSLLPLSPPGCALARLQRCRARHSGPCTLPAHPAGQSAGGPPLASASGQEGRRLGLPHRRARARAPGRRRARRRPTRCAQPRRCWPPGWPAAGPQPPAAWPSLAHGPGQQGGARCSPPAGRPARGAHLAARPAAARAARAAAPAQPPAPAPSSAAAPRSPHCPLRTGCAARAAGPAAARRPRWRGRATPATGRAPGRAARPGGRGRLLRAGTPCPVRLGRRRPGAAARDRAGRVARRCLAGLSTASRRSRAATSRAQCGLTTLAAWTPGLLRTALLPYGGAAVSRREHTPCPGAVHGLTSLTSERCCCHVRYSVAPHQACGSTRPCSQRRTTPVGQCRHARTGITQRFLQTAHT